MCGLNVVPAESLCRRDAALSVVALPLFGSKVYYHSDKSCLWSGALSHADSLTSSCFHVYRTCNTKHWSCWSCRRWTAPETTFDSLTCMRAFICSHITTAVLNYGLVPRRLRSRLSIISNNNSVLLCPPRSCQHGVDSWNPRDVAQLQKQSIVVVVRILAAIRCLCLIVLEKQPEENSSNELRHRSLSVIHKW